MQAKTLVLLVVCTPFLSPLCEMHAKEIRILIRQPYFSVQKELTCFLHLLRENRAVSKRTTKRIRFG